MKIAIVGTGKVARDNYIPFLARQADVTLAYHNRTPATAQAAAESFGGVALPTLEAVADWRPDATLILTSETARYETAMALIQCDGIRRVFFEKPLVAAGGQAHVTEDDFYQARDLLDTARQRGIETAMVFNYRFFVQTQAARRVAEERDFGPVIHAVGLVHYACWSHCIDLVAFFAGEVAELTALSGSVVRTGPGVGIAAADVTAAFRMANGATGTLIGSAALSWQYPLYELILTFEHGRVHLRDLDGTLEILDSRGNSHETLSLTRHTSRWDQYAASFRASLTAYLDSIRQNHPPPVPGIAGLRELQVEAAIKRSIADRRPVLVQAEFPLTAEAAT